MGNDQDRAVLEQAALSIPEQAKALTILDDSTYTAAGGLLRSIKGLRAQVDDAFDPIIASAHAAHKKAIEQKRKVEAPLTEGERILKDGMGSYHDGRGEETPKVSGVSLREAWDVEIVDEGKIPREYMAPDMKKIRGVVRSLGERHKIKGIKVSRRTTIAATKADAE